MRHKKELDAFYEVLDLKQVQNLQIIHSAISLSAVIFALVTTFLVISNPPTQPSQADFAFIQTLSYALIGVSSLMYLAAFIFLFRHFLKQAGHSSPETAFSPIRSAVITRLALVEGVAILGCIVSYLAASYGVSQVEPLYWFSLLPVGILIIFSYFGMPDELKVGLYYSTGMDLVGKK